jgi:hypothetical protein
VSAAAPVSAADSATAAAPTSVAAPAGTTAPASTADTARTTTPARAATAAGARPLAAADAGRGQQASGAEPSQIYGPDDPAYGPPAPGWYQRGEEQAPRTENVSVAAESAEQPSAVRGPFEPLRLVGQQAADEPGEQTAGDQPEEPDVPDFLDFGPPTDPEAGTLGDLRDMYLTAEAITPARLERHFDELLEKQRKLISEYFKESAGLSVDESSSGSAAPFGFDSANSLAALRGELRST